MIMINKIEVFDSGDHSVGIWDRYWYIDWESEIEEEDIEAFRQEIKSFFEKWATDMRVKVQFQIDNVWELGDD